MVGWAELEAAEPELAAAGRALLCQESGVAIGFLATVSQQGVPHLAPVCPIFCEEGLCLSVGAATPKRRDLDTTGRYVLHAFLGPRDAEFRVSGLAERLDAVEVRRRVHSAIPFAAFGVDDPIYRLRVAECLYVYWENVGQPGTRPVRRGWRAPGYGGPVL